MTINVLSLAKEQFQAVSFEGALIDQIAFLSQRQIEWLTSVQLGRVLSHMATSQLRYLTYTQLINLTNPDLDVTSPYFRGTLLSNLTTGQIQSLAAYQVNSLSSQQLGRIDASGHQVLADLLPIQISWLYVPVLTPGQLQTLNQSQVRSLTVNQLKSVLQVGGRGLLSNLSPSQIPWLSTVQVPALEASSMTGAQIESLTSEQISLLTMVQLEGILGYLKDAQIQSLSIPQIQALTLAQLYSTNIHGQVLLSNLAQAQLQSIKIEHNLIRDGGFESGRNFITDYRILNQVTDMGTAAVVTSPPAWGLGSAMAHDGSRFLMVHGAIDNSKRVWAQTVTLQAGMTYDFSCWVNANDGVQLQLLIEGIPVGRGVFIPQSGGGWQKWMQSFRAAVSQDVTLSVRDLSTIAVGNDFGLDDLSFQARNLIQDGGFEAGRNFLSEYQMLDQVTGAGTISLVSSPPPWGMGSNGPHSGAKFLMVDGATDSSKRVWSQSVRLQAGLTYDFSGWISANDGVQLQLMIDGIDVGSVFNPVSGKGWQKWEMSFISTITGNAWISIRDRGTASGENDFGLDDFRLQAHNLFQDGGFESAQGFQTDYRLLDQARGEGTAGVVASPPPWGLGSNAAHGGGKFLMIDGANASSKRVWAQTVTLHKDNPYSFSVWVMANAGVQLQLMINGIDIGASFVPIETGWQQWRMSFTATASGPSEVAIRDLGTDSTNNDFGLDDFQLDISTVPTNRTEINVPEIGHRRNRMLRSIDELVTVIRSGNREEYHRKISYLLKEIDFGNSDLPTVQRFSTKSKELILRGYSSRLSVVEWLDIAKTTDDIVGYAERSNEKIGGPNFSYNEEIISTIKWSSLFNLMLRIASTRVFSFHSFNFYDALFLRDKLTDRGDPDYKKIFEKLPPLYQRSIKDFVARLEEISFPGTWHVYASPHSYISGSNIIGMEAELPSFVFSEGATSLIPVKKNLFETNALGEKAYPLISLTVDRTGDNSYVEVITSPLSGVDRIQVTRAVKRLFATIKSFGRSVSLDEIIETYNGQQGNEQLKLNATPLWEKTRGNATTFGTFLELEQLHNLSTPSNQFTVSLSVSDLAKESTAVDRLAEWAEDARISDVSTCVHAAIANLEARLKEKYPETKLTKETKAFLYISGMDWAERVFSVITTKSFTKMGFDFLVRVNRSEFLARAATERMVEDLKILISSGSYDQYMNSLYNSMEVSGAVLELTKKYKASPPSALMTEDFQITQNFENVPDKLLSIAKQSVKYGSFDVENEDPQGVFDSTFYGAQILPDLSNSYVMSADINSGELTIPIEFRRGKIVSKIADGLYSALDSKANETNSTLEKLLGGSAAASTFSGSSFSYDNVLGVSEEPSTYFSRRVVLQMDDAEATSKAAQYLLSKYRSENRIALLVKKGASGELKYFQMNSDGNLREIQNVSLHNELSSFKVVVVGHGEESSDEYRISGTNAADLADIIQSRLKIISTDTINLVACNPEEGVNQDIQTAFARQLFELVRPEKLVARDKLMQVAENGSKLVAQSTERGELIWVPAKLTPKIVISSSPDSGTMVVRVVSDIREDTAVSPVDVTNASGILGLSESVRRPIVPALAGVAEDDLRRRLTADEAKVFLTAGSDHLGMVFDASGEMVNYGQMVFGLVQLVQALRRGDRSAQTKALITVMSLQLGTETLRILNSGTGKGVNAVFVSALKAIESESASALLATLGKSAGAIRAIDGALGAASSVLAAPAYALMMPSILTQLNSEDPSEVALGALGMISSSLALIPTPVTAALAAVIGVIQLAYSEAYSQIKYWQSYAAFNNQLDVLQKSDFAKQLSDRGFTHLWTYGNGQSPVTFTAPVPFPNALYPNIHLYSTNTGNQDNNYVGLSLTGWDYQDHAFNTFGGNQRLLFPKGGARNFFLGKDGITDTVAPRTITLEGNLDGRSATLTMDGVLALSGDDYFDTGSGGDFISAGAGNDIVIAGYDLAYVDGGAGVDFVGLSRMAGDGRRIYVDNLGDGRVRQLSPDTVTYSVDVDLGSGRGNRLQLSGVTIAGTTIGSKTLTGLLNQIEGFGVQLPLASIERAIWLWNEAQSTWVVVTEVVAKAAADPDAPTYDLYDEKSGRWVTLYLRVNEQLSIAIQADDFNPQVTIQVLRKNDVTGKAVAISSPMKYKYWLGKSKNVASNTTAGFDYSYQKKTVDKLAYVNNKFTIQNVEDVKGTKNDDRLIGSDANNKIEGGGGNDLLIGMGGDDILTSNNGQGTMDGGDGNDVLMSGDGSSGTFLASGDDGEDAIYAGGINNILYGGRGYDRYYLSNQTGTQQSVVIEDFKELLVGDQTVTGADGYTYTHKSITGSHTVYDPTANDLYLSDAGSLGIYQIETWGPTLRIKNQGRRIEMHDFSWFGRLYAGSTDASQYLDTRWFNTQRYLITYRYDGVAQKTLWSTNPSSPENSGTTLGLEHVTAQQTFLLGGASRPRTLDVFHTEYQKNESDRLLYDRNSGNVSAGFTNANIRIQTGNLIELGDIRFSFRQTMESGTPRNTWLMGMTFGNATFDVNKISEAAPRLAVTTGAGREKVVLQTVDGLQVRLDRYAAVIQAPESGGAIHGIANTNTLLNGGKNADRFIAENGDNLGIGGMGNDYLSLGNGRNTYDGGLGDDILAGGKGNDVYLFGRNDGNDVITETGGFDRVVFAKNLGIGNLWFERRADALIVRTAATADTSSSSASAASTLSVAITHFFTSVIYRVEQFVLQDQDGKPLVLRAEDVSAYIKGLTQITAAAMTESEAALALSGYWLKAADFTASNPAGGPTVSVAGVHDGMTVSAGSILHLGDMIQVTLKYVTALSLDIDAGAPSLQINIGSNTAPLYRNAILDTALSTAKNKVFTYTLSGGDKDYSGSISAGALLMNGAVASWANGGTPEKSTLGPADYVSVATGFTISGRPGAAVLDSVTPDYRGNINIKGHSAPKVDIELYWTDDSATKSSHYLTTVRTEDNGEFSYTMTAPAVNGVSLTGRVTYTARAYNGLAYAPGSDGYAHWNFETEFPQQIQLSRGVVTSLNAKPGTYRPGQTIDVHLKMDSSVMVDAGSFPYASLLLNGMQTALAIYAPDKSTSSDLVFSYTVKQGDEIDTTGIKFQGFPVASTFKIRGNIDGTPHYIYPVAQVLSGVYVDNLPMPAKVTRFYAGDVTSTISGDASPGAQLVLQRITADSSSTVMLATGTADREGKFGLTFTNDKNLSGNSKLRLLSGFADNPNPYVGIWTSESAGLPGGISDQGVTVESVLPDMPNVYVVGDTVKLTILMGSDTGVTEGITPPKLELIVGGKSVFARYSAKDSDWRHKVFLWDIAPGTPTNKNGILVKQIVVGDSAWSTQLDSNVSANISINSVISPGILSTDSSLPAHYTLSGLKVVAGIISGDLKYQSDHVLQLRVHNITRGTSALYGLKTDADGNASFRSVLSDMSNGNTYSIDLLDASSGLTIAENIQTFKAMAPAVRSIAVDADRLTPGQILTFSLVMNENTMVDVSAGVPKLLFNSDGNSYQATYSVLESSDTVKKFTWTVPGNISATASPLNITGMNANGSRWFGYASEAAIMTPDSASINTSEVSKMPPEGLLDPLKIENGILTLTVRHAALGETVKFYATGNQGTALLLGSAIVDESGIGNAKVDLTQTGLAAGAQTISAAIYSPDETGIGIVPNTFDLNLSADIVVAITPPQTGLFYKGDYLLIKVTMSEKTYIDATDGLPKLVVKVGEIDQTAVYVAGLSDERNKIFALLAPAIDEPAGLAFKRIDQNGSVWTDSKGALLAQIASASGGSTKLGANSIAITSRNHADGLDSMVAGYANMTAANAAALLLQAMAGYNSGGADAFYSNQGDFTAAQATLVSGAYNASSGYYMGYLRNSS